MSTFKLYLWKEWREQRVPLGALTLMLPILVVTVGFSLPRNLGTSAVFVAAASVLALIVALVTVEGELLTLDPRRSGQWHERLPCGLAGAFPAKLVMFLVSTALALVFGILLATVVVLARGGRIFEEIVPDHDFSGLLVCLGLPLAMGPWTFAASAWCSRGAIAFGAGTLLACGLGFPLLGFFITDYQYERAELIGGVTLFLGGALVSAWLGFVHGASLGRGLGRAVWVGGGSGALALAPILGWGLYQLHERTRFELDSPHCEIEHAWVSGDGRVAVVEARMRLDRWPEQLPSRTIWIDLERGEARELQIASPAICIAGSGRKPGGLSEYETLVLDGLDCTVALDARTGQLLEREDDENDTWISDAGLGVSYWDEDYEYYYDPFHDLERSASEVGIDRFEAVWIGPEGWWIQGDGWRRYDPSSGASEPAEWLAPLAQPLDMLVDGRLIGLQDDGTLALADPQTCSVTAVLGARCLAEVEVQCVELQSSDERILADERAYYRLDALCGELAELPLAPEDWPLRRLDDGDLVLLAAEGFVRLEADGVRHPLVRLDALHIQDVTP